MNSDIKLMKNNTSRHENLKKEHNEQIYKGNNNSDDPKAIQRISDARRVIFDNLNQSTKQKPNSSLASTCTKNISSDKHQMRKLVDSKQVSGPFHQSDKKTFLLDTYARIVATNNRRCPKQLRELAKLRRQARSNQNDGSSANFDLNYGHAAKTYINEARRTLKKSKN